MGDHNKTFEWIEFPQGKVRYAGGRRGRDEPSIYTFAVDIEGRIYFGEIRSVFMDGGNQYNLEIVSFGWLKHDWLGTEPDPELCAAFRPGELRKVQSLLLQAIPVWRNLEVRPTILSEYGCGRFMGHLIFRDGWALLVDDGNTV